MNKETKIRNRLQPLLRAGLLRLPKHAEWLSKFVEEVRTFPTGEHDDMLDSLAMVEDARTDRLITSFDASTCVIPEIPIPAHWPMWASLVADPTGEAVMLMLSCSPEGKLYITDQLFAAVSPEELYTKYRDRIGNRKVLSVSAPDKMWKENPINGKVWIQTFREVGFRIIPGPGDWENQIANLSRNFTAPEGSAPKLQVFPKCKRLLWELYNAAIGEQKDPSRKSIQALMLLLSMGPRWRDMNGSAIRSGRTLVYPDADIP